jgi:hypothetical protein
MVSIVEPETKMGPGKWQPSSVPKAVAVMALLASRHGPRCSAQKPTASRCICRLPDPQLRTALPRATAVKSAVGYAQC